MDAIPKERLPEVLKTDPQILGILHEKYPELANKWIQNNPETFTNWIRNASPEDVHKHFSVLVNTPESIKKLAYSLPDVFYGWAEKLPIAKIDEIKPLFKKTGSNTKETNTINENISKKLEEIKKGKSENKTTKVSIDSIKIPDKSERNQVTLATSPNKATNPQIDEFNHKFHVQNDLIGETTKQNKDLVNLLQKNRDGRQVQYTESFRDAISKNIQNKLIKIQKSELDPNTGQPRRSKTLGYVEILNKPILGVNVNIRNGDVRFGTKIFDQVFADIAVYDKNGQLIGTIKNADIELHYGNSPDFKQIIDLTVKLDTEYNNSPALEVPEILTKLDPLPKKIIPSPTR